MLEDNSALVKFDSEDDAIYAVDTVNSTDMGGSKMQVSYASQYEMDQSNPRGSDDWAHSTRVDRFAGDNDYNDSRGRGAWPGERSRERSRERDDKSFVKVVGLTSEDETSRHLWVGNIANDVTSTDLEREFGKFGDVDRVS